jgi:hypothetical protein
MRTVHVNEGEVGSRIHHALANDQSETARTTSDHADVAIQSEGAQGRLHVLTTRAVDGLAAGKLVLGGVFDLDLRICSRIFTRLVLARRVAVDAANGGKGGSQDGHCGCG